MIKVIIAVSGLLFVEPNLANKTITVHFLETVGSAIPELSRPSSPITLGDHDLTGDIFGVAVTSTPFQLSLAVTPPTGATLNLTEAAAFPDVHYLIGKTASRVRSKCKFTSTAIADCIADGKRLLNGQIQLSGNWTMKAIDTQRDLPGSGRDPMAPMQRWRSLAANPAYSVVHSFPAYPFANTFVFETIIAKADDLTVTGGTFAIDTVDCSQYDEAYPVCAIVRIDNACTKDCKLTVGSAWTDADLHFSQIYRLLDVYDPNTKDFAQALFVPFGQAGSGHGGLGGGVSPRCYGGYASP